jgi:hypothetical protein
MHSVMIFDSSEKSQKKAVDITLAFSLCEGRLVSGDPDCAAAASLKTLTSMASVLK